MSTKNVDKIDPRQCRAARALLGMSQTHLAQKAGLGLSTIVDFEKERRRISKEAISAIAAALEQAGISFIDENGGGQGVRFRNPRKNS